MNVSFFPDPSPAPEPEQPATPPWFQPPEDEYPVRVLVREFLARTDATALTLSHIDVYSTGLRIKMEWELRRRGESIAEWQLAGRMGPYFNGAGDPELQRRFGLALSDGTVVTTVDNASRYDNFYTQPQGWSLMDQASGGGGGESNYSGTSGLWLWPLPPAGPMELVAEWAARGIPESRVRLDAKALLAAADSVRSLWPCEGLRKTVIGAPRVGIGRARRRPARRMPGS